MSSKVECMVKPENCPKKRDQGVISIFCYRMKPREEP